MMTGDGELQEGQNWEALQAAAHERLRRLWVVVDRNEVQSDKRTEEILALGDLETKLRAFGWHVETADGHDHVALRAAFARFRAGADTPKALVARTVKGKGVSFMEHPVALAEGGGMYRWHAGAPATSRSPTRSPSSSPVSPSGARPSASSRPKLRIAEPETDVRGLEGKPESGAGSRRPAVTDEYVVEAYGEALLELAAERDDLVVLDADLASDCRASAPSSSPTRSTSSTAGRGAGHGLHGRGHGPPRAASRS